MSDDGPSELPLGFGAEVLVREYTFGDEVCVAVHDRPGHGREDFGRNECMTSFHHRLGEPGQGPVSGFGLRAFVTHVHQRLLEHHSEMPDVVTSKVDVGDPGRFERVDRVRSPGRRGGQSVRELCEALTGDLGKDALVVAEDMIRRLMAHSGSTRHLSEGDVAHPVLGDECDAGVQDLAAEVGHAPRPYLRKTSPSRPRKKHPRHGAQAGNTSTVPWPWLSFEAAEAREKPASTCPHGLPDRRILRTMGWYDVFAFFYDRALEDLYAPHRAAAIEALHLRPGMTVLDAPCGTGQSLPDLAAKVGPSGAVVGVDASSGMLGKARRRVEKSGLVSVSLHQAMIPDGLDAVGTEPHDAIFCALGLSALPQSTFSALWARLRPGGRFVLFDVFAEKPSLQTRIVEQMARARLTHRDWLQLESAALETEDPQRAFRRVALPADPAQMGGELYFAVGVKPARSEAPHP